MKKFQSIIQRYITNHEKHKKYLAGVLALSVLVSFGVSAGLIMPAVSMTEDDVVYYYNDNIKVLSADNTANTLENYANEDGNIIDGITYSPNNASVKDLLIGVGKPDANDTSLNWAAGANTAESIAQMAKKEYFLGIAYDFCLFTHNDAYLTAADAEGRVAVGGNITFSGNYNYQLGAGNFAYSTALKDTDDYLTIEGFAHAIVGGYMKNMNPVSASDTRNGALYRPGLIIQDNGTQFFPADEDLYKRFIVGDFDNSSHIVWLESNGWVPTPGTPYGDPNDSHAPITPLPDEKSQIYKQPTGGMIDFNDTFDFLKKQSEALSKKSGIDATYDEGTNTIIFDAEGAGDNETIYFNLPDNIPLKGVSIEFRNVPMKEGEMVIRDVNDPNTLITETQKIPACNLVINAGRSTFEIGPSTPDEKGTTKTTITGYNINDPTQTWTEVISNDNDITTNNHLASSKILYNFYNASSPDVENVNKVSGNAFENKINGNFNGVILAPDANVKSKEEYCTGHLSGALISKNFFGGLEIGYRPYRGKNKELLPSNSGYGVPIKKVIEGGGNLAGATFGLFEIENGTPKSTAENTFKSDSNGDGYMNINSKVDFAGGKEYTSSNNVITTEYVIKETDAPAGFIKDDSQEYRITVTETVDLGSIINIDGKNIPTKVTTTITQGGESFTIELQDIYSYENDTYRRVRRELKVYEGTDTTGNCDTFLMDIDGTKGTVSKVMKETGSPSADTITINEFKGTQTSLSSYIVSSALTVTVAGGEPAMVSTTVNVDTSNMRTLDQLAWSMENATDISIDEMKVFYKKDDNTGVVKTYKASEFTNGTLGSWWQDISLSDNVDKANIIGMQFKFKKNDESATIDSSKVYKLAFKAEGASGAEELITFSIKDIDNEVFVPAKFPIPTTYSPPSETENDGDTVEDDANDPVENPEEEVAVLSLESEDEIEETSEEETEETVEVNEEEFPLMYAPSIDVYADETDEEFPLYRETEVVQTTISSGTVTTVVTVASTETSILNCYNTIIANPQESQSYPTVTADNELNYKYDPDTMIMMPQPSNTKTFTNERGLRFRKVSKSSGTISALRGAKINVYSVGANLATGSALMSNILDGGSETTIDLKNITDGQLYCFKETEQLTGYELADPIYFKKSGDTIYYTQDADKAKSNTTNGWDSFAITNAENVIEMVDIKIGGAIIKLGKYNANFANRLGGAKFQLQTSSGDLIYPIDENETFTIPVDKDFNLYETLKDADSTTYNTKYIENGYLKPGFYTLHEIEAPAGGYNTQDFNFKVISNGGTYEIEIPEPGKALYFNTTVGSGNEVMVYPINAEGERISVSNVTKIEILLNSPTSGNLELWMGPFSGDHPTIIDGEVILDNLNNVSFDSFKVQNQAWSDGVDIKEIRIYGEEGEGSGSGSSSSGDYPAGVTFENQKILISGAALLKAKESPDSPFISYDFNASETWADGQIKVNDKYVGNNLSKKASTNNTYSLNEISALSSEYGSISNWTTIELNIWGASFSNVSFPLSTTETETETPTVTTTADDKNYLPLRFTEGAIQIPNQKSGANIDITVEKKWSGDTGFENLRPGSVSVTLKRRNPDGTEDTTFTSDEYTQVLDSTNNWKYKWTKLPKLPEGKEDEDANYYRYYVVEDYESFKDIYTPSYSPKELKGGGTLKVTNKLNTTSIPVKKKWVNSDGTLKTDGTPSLTVQLQWKNSAGKWVNVPDYQDADEKTVSFKRILTLKNSYSYTFSGLPANKEYRVIETEVPDGWTKVEDGDSTNDYTITNKRDTASLTVKKDWNDDEATGKRPNQIQIAVYRTTKIDSSAEGKDPEEDVTEPSPAPNFNPNDVDNLYPDYTSKSYDQTTDYARLMQYSMYFYDANMCGNLSNSSVASLSRSVSSDSKSAIEWRGNCHTYCSVVGGFHDAGDHTMFGLPQGFTASTIGWSYYEFKDSYNTLGLTEHYQKIMKHFCDFFVDSTKLTGDNVTNFLYQKGEGGTDHDYWGSPENQPESQFGKEYWTSNGASDIAANYAAALAQYAINFPKDVNSSNYLKYAKALYAFSTKYNSCTSDGPSGFYWDERTDATDEQAWAATWLYLATEDSKYKTESRSKIIEAQGKLNGEPRGHFWNNTTLGAATVYASHIDKKDSNIKKITTDYLTKNCTGNDYKIVDWGDWGSARHNTLLQSVALSASKNFDDVDYTDWCAKQMKYILGDNNGSVCLVTGFAPNSVTHVHHRAASVNKSNDNYAHTLVGALAGGPKTTSFVDYPNDVENYVENEVALDYNSGLVMAAAGLYSAYGTGETYSNIATQSIESDIEVLSDTASVDDDVPEDILNGMTVQSNDTPIAIMDNEVAYEDYAFTINKTGVNDEGNPVYGSFDKDVDFPGNVKKIEIIFDEQFNGNGQFQVSGWETLPGHTDGNNQWSLSGNNTYSYNNVDLEITSISFGIWWANSKKESYTGKIRIHYDNSFRITSSENNLTVTENGDPITITANKVATWKASSDVVELTPSADGKSCEVRAIRYTSAPITITATSGSQSDTVEISVNTADIQIVEGTDDIGDNIKLHTNQTRTVTVSPAGGDVSVDVDDDTIVKVTPTGDKYDITSNDKLGDTEVTFTRNGKSKTVEVNVIEPISIEGNGKMNKNSSQTLKAVNAVGNVWWEVLEGDEYIEIDSWTGVVTSKDTIGVKATVKATDSDGTSATFDITLELTAVKPEIPEVGKELYKTVTLTSANNWQATLTDLPKTDAKGNPYYYYIEEIPTKTDGTIDGKGGSIYYPVEYDENGLTLMEGNGTISVTNEKKPETETPGYELPSTGGKGADWYYIIGAGLMSGAVVMFIRRRRRSA